MSKLEMHSPKVTLLAKAGQESHAQVRCKLSDVPRHLQKCSFAGALGAPWGSMAGEWLVEIWWEEPGLYTFVHEVASCWYSILIGCWHSYICLIHFAIHVFLMNYRETDSGMPRAELSIVKNVWHVLKSNSTYFLQRKSGSSNKHPEVCGSSRVVTPALFLGSDFWWVHEWVPISLVARSQIQEPISPGPSMVYHFSSHLLLFGGTTITVLNQGLSIRGWHYLFELTWDHVALVGAFGAHTSTW